MSNKNALGIEDMDKALSVIQIAINDLNDANEQLEKFRTILFSRFGMSAQDNELENSIKYIQQIILNLEGKCDHHKDIVENSKNHMIACDRIDNGLADKAKIWK